MASLAAWLTQVEFETEDDRTVTGRVVRLNQKTATVITAAGR